MGKRQRHKPGKGKGRTRTDKLLETVDPLACLFCGSKESSDAGGHTGNLITSTNFSVHYFCMLFASALYQRGDADDETNELKGFLRDDIFREKRRASKLRCSFCKEPGAPTGCINKKCNMKFHFGCGRRNGVLFQFYGSFCSFCADHRPYQNLNKRTGRLGFKGIARTECPICIRPVWTRTSNNTLKTPCCKKFFHRDCMQQMGTASGYVHFKCPTCNNVDAFRMEMLKCGIYLPDQDAAWELEPNAFTDLNYQYRHCDAPECADPEGRDHYVDQDNHDWEIVRCNLCGSQAVHWKCNKYVDTFTCPGCHSLARTRKRQKKKSKRRNKNGADAMPTKSSEGQSKFQGAKAECLKKRKRSEDEDSPKKRLKSDADETVTTEPDTSATTEGDPVLGTDLDSETESDTSAEFEDPDDIPTESDKVTTATESPEQTTASESQGMSTETESQDESTWGKSLDSAVKSRYSTMESQEVAIVAEPKQKDVVVDSQENVNKTPRKSQNTQTTAIESKNIPTVESKDNNTAVESPTKNFMSIETKNIHNTATTFLDKKQDTQTDTGVIKNVEIISPGSGDHKTKKKKTAIKFWGCGKSVDNGNSNAKFDDFSKVSPEDPTSPSHYVRELPQRRFMCTICLRKFPDYKCRATIHVKAKHLKSIRKNLTMASKPQKQKRASRKCTENKPKPVVNNAPKKRCTKRSQAALQAAEELKKIDKSSEPAWSRALLDNTFLTGNNMGAEFTEISTTESNVGVNVDGETLGLTKDVKPKNSTVSGSGNKSHDAVGAESLGSRDDTIVAVHTSTPTKAGTSRDGTKKKRGRKPGRPRKEIRPASESDNTQSDSGHKSFKQSLLTNFFIRSLSPKTESGHKSSASAAIGAPPVSSSGEPKGRRSKAAPKCKRSKNPKPAETIVKEGDAIVDDKEGSSVRLDINVGKGTEMSYADFLKSCTEENGTNDNDIKTSKQLIKNSKSRMGNVGIELSLKGDSLISTNSKPVTAPRIEITDADALLDNSDILGGSYPTTPTRALRSREVSLSPRSPTTADTPDKHLKALLGAPTLLDARTSLGAPTLLDAPTSLDAPTLLDAPTSLDAPTLLDAPTSLDAPTFNGSRRRSSTPRGLREKVDKSPGCASDNSEKSTVRKSPKFKTKAQLKESLYTGLRPRTPTKSPSSSAVPSTPKSKTNSPSKYLYDALIDAVRDCVITKSPCVVTKSPCVVTKSPLSATGLEQSSSKDLHLTPLGISLRPRTPTKSPRSLAVRTTPKCKTNSPAKSVTAAEESPVYDPLPDVLQDCVVAKSTRSLTGLEKSSSEYRQLPPLGTINLNTGSSSCGPKIPRVSDIINNNTKENRSEHGDNVLKSEPLVIKGRRTWRSRSMDPVQIEAHKQVLKLGIGCFACRVCKKTFTSSYRVRTHIIHVHMKRRLYQCATCDSSFDLKGTRNEHALNCVGPAV